MKIEFDCNELSLDEYFYLLSAEDKEKILKIHIGDYYWTPNGLVGAIQVKAVGFASSFYSADTDWHQIEVKMFPEPQAYYMTIDARLLYKTKAEALCKVRETLLTQIKTTDTELKKYKKILKEYRKRIKRIGEHINERK